MLFVDLLHSLYTRLKYSEFQDITRFFIENEIAAENRGGNRVFLDLLFQFRLDGLYVNFHPVENISNGTFFHTEQS